MKLSTTNNIKLIINGASNNMSSLIGTFSIGTCAITMNSQRQQTQMKSNILYTNHLSDNVGKSINAN